MKPFRDNPKPEPMRGHRTAWSFLGGAGLLSAWFLLLVPAVSQVIPGAMVQTLAGSGHPGFRDGRGTQAELHDPLHLALDEKGSLYVTDGASRSVRRITPTGEVTTLTGGPFPSGYERRRGYPHSLLWPTGVAVRGPDEVYVADGQGHCVYRVNSQGRMWLLAGNGEVGRTDGAGPDARFNFPTGLAIDSQGNLYLSDAGNHCIRKLRLGRLT